MDLEEKEVINLTEFLEMRVALVRDDYFDRNKDVDELVKIDLLKEDLPEPAIEKLKEVCKLVFITNNFKLRLFSHKSS
jgi:hypothetical protein